MLEQTAATKDVLSGASLYADVARYASFGLHRFGSSGDRTTADWIAGELKEAGFDVGFQPVVLGRQYVVERATAESGGASVEATPFWWPPEDKASFHLTAPLVRDGDAAGYWNFLGMAARHYSLHTPGDDLDATGPEILEPVARAFVDAARKMVERGEAAFK